MGPPPSEAKRARPSGAGRPGRVTGGLNEGLGRHRIPECAASAARMPGSIVIAAADPSSVHRCASASITWQLLIELGANVEKSEGAKRRNSGAGRPERVTRGLNGGLDRHRIPECAASAARMFGSIVIAAADPSPVHICASASITWQLLIELFANVGK